METLGGLVLLFIGIAYWQIQEARKRAKEGKVARDVFGDWFRGPRGKE